MLNRWMTSVAAGLLLSAVAGLAGCDSTVININTFDGNVINGEAYDAGAIDLGSAESLVVPEGTIVLPVAGGGPATASRCTSRNAWHGRGIRRFRRTSGSSAAAWAARIAVTKR